MNGRTELSLKLQVFRENSVHPEMREPLSFLFHKES